jgi:TPR repeat protein
MYARGEGVPRNHVQAYMWLSLAIKGGFKPAVEYRDRLAKKMTAAQIAEAENLAIQR